MRINDYQLQAMSFLNKDIKMEDVIVNGVMGLCGESGEVIDLVKKHLYQGHPLDKDKIIKELGDVMWYVAEIAYAIDVPLEKVLELNINKLCKRYPEGFSVKNSINRNEEE